MFSLVIPVYRNQGSVPSLLQALAALATRLPEPLEVIFVVDGSPDACHSMLQASLAGQPHASTLVLLSRNFGAFAAIRAGLEIARGERFAVMAADLQEPPELIEGMQAVLARDQADVVVGVRTARHDPLLSRLASQAFWALYRRFVLPDIPPGGVDVFGGNRAFLNALLGLNESRSSLVGQVFWLGFRRANLPYERRAREHGVSAWTLRRKLAYLSDSIFAFSDLPIRWLMRLGALGTLVAIALGLSAALGRLLGLIEVPGYAMTLLALLFFGTLNLLGLGIVGSYAWRAYENTKARPLAVVLKVDHFTGQS